MNTYYFKINAVDAHVSQDGLDNVIYNVHWSYFAEDGEGHTASMIGVQHIPNVDPDNFTAFDQLTQADVIAWIEPELDLQQLQSALDQNLTELAAPTKVTLQVPETLADNEVVE